MVPLMVFRSSTLCVHAHTQTSMQVGLESGIPFVMRAAEHTTYIYKHKLSLRNNQVLQHVWNVK